MQLSQTELHELLDYDPLTGEFTYLKNVGSRAVKGKKAGYHSVGSYIFIRIKGYRYRAHILAWLYVYGEFPKFELDHIDCNKHNNRIDNLRQVTRCENKWNVGLSKSNTSGYKNITFCSSKNSWLVALRHKYGQLRKRVESLELAILVAEEARKLYHGIYARGM